MTTVLVYFLHSDLFIKCGASIGERGLVVRPGRREIDVLVQCHIFGVYVSKVI